MNQTKQNNKPEIREQKLGSVDQACSRYSLGRNTMRNLASEARAVVRIGKCYRINFDVMDKYIDDLTGRAVNE